MSASFHIRPYRETDRMAVLQLLALNTPAYFAETEKADFEHYLDHEREQYFVVEHENSVVGCGGINLDLAQHTAKISWDIIHPDFQGKGIGRALLQHRIRILRQTENVRNISVRISQLAWPFYAKNGFVLQQVFENYWAEGFDMYEMMYSK